MSTKTYTSLILGSLMCSTANANNVYIAVDSYDYEFRLGSILLDLKPIGIAVGGNYYLNDNTYIQYELGTWSDDPSLGNQNRIGAGPSLQGASDFDSGLFNLGLGRSFNNWDVSFSYTNIEDDLGLEFGRDLELSSQADIDSQSFRLLARNNKEIGLWTRKLAFGVQYDNVESNAFIAEARQSILQESNTSYAFASFGGDYYIPAKSNSGWFLGSSISWYQELSSTDRLTELNQVSQENQGEFLPIPTLGNRAAGAFANGGAGVNRTFGNSFGLLDLYVTYQLSPSWSLDLISGDTDG